MPRDPIVEEVRRYREENAARFGFDVRKIAEDMLTRQATSGHRVVDLSKQNKAQHRLPKAVATVAKRRRAATRNANG